MIARLLVNGVSDGAVASDDRGLQYGDGLFETMAVVAGRPQRWERHLARLRRGAGRLAIALPPAELLREEAHQICAGAEQAVLKLIITRGRGGRGYAYEREMQATRIFRLGAWPKRPAGWWSEGVAVRFCDTRLASNPRLAGIKHLNRLEQVLARAEWADDYAEGIMLDDQGRVIEGTMSNVFAVIDGTIKTPDLSGCGVEGVMREVVLDRARARRIPVAIGVIAPDELAGAEEMFLTNSLIGVWPVHTLERSVRRQPAVPYPVGPLTRRLQAEVAHGE